MADVFDSEAGVKEKMGITGAKIVPEVKLTPLEKVDASNFERSDPLLFMRRDKGPGKPLDQELVELGKASIDVFRRYLAGMANHARASGFKENYDFGTVAKMVGNAGISDAGPDGRFFLTFSTTNMLSDTDWRVSSSSMLFDREIKSFESYPARLDDDDFILGQKAGKKEYEVVGTFADLFSQHGEKMGEALKGAGWEKLAETSVSDFDRHSGWLDKHDQE